MNSLRSFGTGRALLRLLAAVTLGAAVALGLYACKNSTDEEGVVGIGLTDAAGDFLTYTVDVTSLTLTKADGTVVQTLPQRTRVDFAQFVDLTEFMTAATIPSGTYVSATLNLDYASADIQVDDGNGAPVAVPLANIHDSQGVQVTTMSMMVRLDNARQLVIARGLPALLDLDFNLAASNLVNMSGPVVTVNPLLVADVNPDAPKPHRIRGPLDSVNTQAGSFTLILQPFNLLQGDHGRLTFLTDGNTTFEIDQTSFTGSAGLAALAAKPQLTATVAIGTLDLTTRRFTATEVLAGSSVPFGTSDVLTGNVISRSSGTTFVVKGAELVRSSGTLIFRDTVTVTVASGTTRVIKQGTMGTFATGDISIGQRVTVLGTLTNATVGSTTMDASSGLVRLLITQLNGHANGVPAGNTLVMTLDRIDGRPISLFNFSGTGTTMGNDANPISYQVAAGALNLAGIVASTPLKVRGFVQPFGLATATDDFNAITLIDVTNAPATLVVGWPSLEAAPFNSYTASGMKVNLLNAGPPHDVFRGGVDTPLSTSDTPTVLATNPARGLFAIGDNGTVQVYTRLSAYQAALQAELALGRQARGFVASGGNYFDATKTLTANAMAAVLQ
ncbi:MAG TPA: hypothetical protein VK643_11085 [Burkholderiales bacterium]|nr:hypothetical protein [Burkholderiales bacterium]